MNLGRAIGCVGWMAWSSGVLAQEENEWRDFEEEEEVFDEFEEDSGPDGDLFADAVPVFVSEFQSSSKEYLGLAALMRDFLEERVGAHPMLRTISVHEAPDFGEHSAQLYLETCPVGEQVGCAYVVAQKVEAAYALVGTVHERAGERAVELSVVDVVDGREAFSLQVDLELGGDDRLAEGVVGLLVSIVEGTAGQVKDIRQDGAQAVDSNPIDTEEVARQLQELAEELGGITAIDQRGNKRVDKPEYTLADLDREESTDSAKQWELLGITAEEYLAWRNSGMTLHAWKVSQLGRRGELLVRPVAGPARGPFDTTYYAIFAIEEEPPNAVIDTYAWQGFQPGTGLSGGGWIGFGLTATLEVDVGGGVNLGGYTLYARQQDGDEPPEERSAQTVQQMNTWVGARMYSVLRFKEGVRPLLGSGLVWRQGHSYTDYWEPIRSSGGETPLPEFSPPTLLEAQFVPGLELTLGSAVDLCISLPIGLGVGGSAVRNTQGENEYILQKDAPDGLSLLSVGLEIGLVLHLFGPEIEMDDLYMETMDEPLD
ncbi:MAG: hypothetical protein VX519_03380 [Myxococcota bacterium]|nr:hypothetical protein [Myxococcota bacterium]